jgi:hypothetical protein
MHPQKNIHHEFQKYQTQTTDQPAQNNGILYQLTVAPVEPPCSQTTHHQHGS